MTVYRLIRAVFGPLVRAVWHVEVVGLEHLPSAGCVLAPNHDSLSDPLLLGAALPRPLSFLTKAELYRFGLGPVLRRLGAIPVRRGAADRGAVEEAVAAARRGAAVVVYPQGTVLGSSDRRWRRGAARVAIEAGVPLVPIAILGSDQVLRPGTWRVRLARVCVVVCAPLDIGPPRSATQGEAAELVERARVAIEVARARSA